MNLRFKMLVFDLDGTLFDTMGILNQLAQAAMQKHHKLAPEFGSGLYKKTSGLPFRYQLERIFPGHPANDAASADFETAKSELYKKPVSPFPEVVEHLRLWKTFGYKIAVSSNDEEANVFTKIGPYRDCFDEILGHKPGFLKGKAHFDLLQKKYDLKPGEILFVGDSLHDCKMAVENGIAFVGRIGTFERADFLALGTPCELVSDFFELHGLLQQKLA